MKIYIDVFVAAVGETVEVRCESHMKIIDFFKQMQKLVKEKYGVMLQQENAVKNNEERNFYWICNIDNAEILSDKDILWEKGIINGSRLMIL